MMFKQLNNRWKIILGSIILFCTIYVGIISVISRRNPSQSKDIQYWEVGEMEEESNSTNLNWMERPTVLSRMNLDWNVDFDTIIDRCNQKKVTTAACLRYVSNNREEFMKKRETGWKDSNETMIYHAFWGGLWTDKLALFCKSWLFTQRLGKAQLWIWMESDSALASTPSNTLSSSFAPFSEIILNGSEPSKNKEETYLVFRKFDWGHVYQSSKEFSNFQKGTFQFESDMVRIAMLHYYGGMYLDVDALLLRDLGDLYLSGREFAYEWSNTGYVNTAVFYLKKQGNTAKAIIEGAVNLKSWPTITPPFHPWHYLNYVRNSKLPGANLAVLPCAIFDPIWLVADKIGQHMNDKLTPPFETFGDFFEMKILQDIPRVMTNFLDGAWILHWHGNGKWGRTIYKNSWVGVWDSLFDCFIQKRCQNLYGEKIKYNRYKETN